VNEGCPIQSNATKSSLCCRMPVHPPPRGWALLMRPSAAAAAAVAALLPSAQALQVTEPGPATSEFGHLSVFNSVWAAAHRRAPPKLSAGSRADIARIEGKDAETDLLLPSLVAAVCWSTRLGDLLSCGRHRLRLCLGLSLRHANARCFSGRQGFAVTCFAR